jgi:hypothetical protein
MLCVVALSLFVVSMLCIVVVTHRASRNISRLKRV